MHPHLQKLLASLGGVLVFALAVAWAFYAAKDVAQILGHKTGLASEFVAGDAVYKKFGDIYTTFSVIGLALAAGLAFTLLAWERRPKRWRIEITFWALLAVSLPLSIVNFWSGDIYVSQSQQVYLNLIQVFLAAVCSLQLSRQPASSDTALVLKSMTLFLLLAFGLFVPSLFTIVWLLHWQKAISYATSESFSPAWVSAISGIASLGVSIQQYRLAKAKQTGTSGESASRIILK